MPPKSKKQKINNRQTDENASPEQDLFWLITRGDREKSSDDDDDEEEEEEDNEENEFPSTPPNKKQKNNDPKDDDKKDKDYKPGKNTQKRKKSSRSRGFWWFPSELTSSSYVQTSTTSSSSTRLAFQPINLNVDLNNNNIINDLNAPNQVQPHLTSEMRIDEQSEEIALPLYAKESFYRDYSDGVVQREFHLLKDLINNYTYEEYDPQTAECLKESARQAKYSVDNEAYFYLGKHALEFKYRMELDADKHSIHLYNSNNTDKYLKSLIFFNFLIINQDHTESELIDLSEDELTQSLMSLVYKKRIEIVADRFECDNEVKIGYVHFDIYLNQYTKQNFAHSANPSDFMKYQMANEMHLVMNNVYLNRFDVDQKNIARALTNKEYDEDNEEYFRNASDPKPEDDKNENFFDLVYDIHKKDNVLTSWDDEDVDRIQDRSCLRPELRPYQINGIKWMLKKEGFRLESDEKENKTGSSQDDNLHPLYLEIVNEKTSQKLFYHKYFSLFMRDKPIKKDSLPGGILADEMGLGKTLEVIGCVLINKRQNVSLEIEPSETIKKSRKKAFSCHCGRTPREFAYYDDEDAVNSESGNKIPVIQCSWCSVWTHINCINYNGRKEDFLCLQCCTKIKPIKSGCTLIVTPYVISHQWVDEINKHVMKEKVRDLKVLVYKGTQSGFIQPRDLSKYDICLTTYDVLSNELSNVFAIENMRELRQPKRFMKIPSPLMYVEWWRICLDEAQMVHSSNSRCAEMANRLNAINRWCITGTPIGRSLADLHGLFAFIREDPYCEKRWFKQVLFDPYKSGDKEILAKEVSKVLWRTAKKYVQDQINIPKQTEKIYWLNFSPFEVHLYERVLEKFREHRQNSFRSMNENSYHAYRNENSVGNVVYKYFNTIDQNLKLDEIDLQIIDQILTPIYDLRITCNHPQLILQKRSFMAQNPVRTKKDKLLSMEKSLEILMKKTRKECENAYRLVAMQSNSLAALSIINKNYRGAIQMYQKILDSEKDMETHEIYLDYIQKAHTFFNFVDCMESNLLADDTESLVEGNFKLKIGKLKKELTECEDEYMDGWIDKKFKAENKMRAKVDDLQKILKKHQDTYLADLLEVLSIVQDSDKSSELWNKLGAEFRFYEHTDENNNEVHVRYNLRICNKTIKNYEDLKLLLSNEYAKLFENRDIFIDELTMFFDKNTKYKARKNKKTDGITDEMVTKAADCHFNRDLVTFKVANNIPDVFMGKCEICTSEEALKSYGDCLFNDLSEALKTKCAKSKEDKNESDEDSADEDTKNLEKEMEKRMQNQGIKQKSDIETVAKIIYSFSKYVNSLESQADTTKDFLDTYSLLKEEFKVLNEYWMRCKNQIGAYNDFDRGKMRFRLIKPNEVINNKPSYVLLPHEVEFQVRKCTIDKSTAEADLKKRLCQFIYLKNLQTTYNLADGKENEDPCPICQCNLGHEWYIIQCGHLYCKECYTLLLQNQQNDQMPHMMMLQHQIHQRKDQLKCALCREICNHSESFLVTTNTKLKELEEQKQAEHDSIQEAKSVAHYQDNSSELERIKIKGECNSAKVEGVVKCLINILSKDKYAKCIIFSEHTIVLELINKMLKDNYISYQYVNDEETCKKCILEFKTGPSNVLLMPYSFGANGLNITEATHVLLVEPTLNRAQEAQAIGRVHRIGQTKPTYVHRFMIRSTIEDLVYRLFKNNSSYSSTTSAASNQIDTTQPNCSKVFEAMENASVNVSVESERKLTIGDLHNLFQNL